MNNAGLKLSAALYWKALQKGIFYSILNDLFGSGLFRLDFMN